jgi:hypothetical protein
MEQDQSRPVAKLFAGGRALSGISAFWPGYPEGLLYLWPSARRRVGLNIQRLASLDASHDAIKQYLHWLSQIPYQEFGLSRDLGLGRAFARAFARVLSRDLDLTLALYLAHDFSRDLARARALDFDLALDLGLARALDRALALNHARAIALDHAFDLACELTRELDSKSPEKAVSSLAVQLPFVSSLRSSLSFLQIDPAHNYDDTALPVVLMTLAARASIVGEPEQQRLMDAVDGVRNRNIDPFWLALARHVARISTGEDRKLLEDLAAYPEKREAPLSWGLQYIVRGDVLMGDGSEVTLDELCDEAGVPRYPLLEEMPAEIE